MSDLGRTGTAARIAAALIAALLCLTACSAQAESVVGPASFQSAINRAQGGEVIRLAGGRYPPLVLNDRKFARRLTITSADPGRPAQFPAMRFTRSSGLAISDIVVMDPAISNYGNLIVVRESSDIAFSRVKTFGDAPGGSSKNGFGVAVSKSQRISFLDGEIAFLNRGLSVNTSQDVNISGNRVHRMQSDGFNFVEVARVKISRNRFWDFAPVPGDHPDAIQFWTVNAKAPSTDVEISENLILAAPNQIQPQGIFMTDQKGNLPYARVQIRDNILVGTSWNGIMLLNALDSAIIGNRLFTVGGRHVNATWIRVNRMTGIISDNVAKQYMIGRDQQVVQRRNSTRNESESAARKAIEAWDGGRAGGRDGGLPRQGDGR